MPTTTDYEKKRNEILDCAEHLFISKSYESTTVNTILRELNIAKGTFYYYFKSKEEVMDAVIMRIINDELQYAKQILVKKDMSAFDKLISILFNKPKSNNNKDAMVDTLHVADNALMKQRALQRTIEFICPVLADIISEGNANEEFSSDYPLADIQFLIAGFQSLYDLSNIERSNIKVDLESMLDIIFQVLKINENKLSRDQVKKRMAANL